MFFKQVFLKALKKDTHTHMYALARAILRRLFFPQNRRSVLDFSARMWYIFNVISLRHYRIREFL